jgi:hypothetical protein
MPGFNRNSRRCILVALYRSTDSRQTTSVVRHDRTPSGPPPGLSIPGCSECHVNGGSSCMHHGHGTDLKAAQRTHWRDLLQLIASTFSIRTQFTVLTGKTCGHPRVMPLVTRMFALKHAWDPMASSSVNFCRKRAPCHLSSLQQQ